jgi:hypothetical protein
MLKTVSAVVVLWSLASAAAAGESKLDGAAITALLSDHEMAGRDNGREWRQIFQRSGATFYSVGAAQTQGNWEVRGDQYCSVWPPSTAWACYDMTSDGERYFFISGTGERSEAKLLK